MNPDFRIGPWLVQPSLNSISQNGSSTRLEPKVMAVLVCLADHPGEVVTKEKLLGTVWPGTFVGDDVLKRSVSELRRILKDDAHESQIIETIPRRGYRLLLPVDRLNGLAPKIALPGHAEFVPARHDFARRWRLAAAYVSAALLLLGLGLYFNAGGTVRWLAREHIPAIRSLAVLPLQNLSDDPRQEYFAEGVTDALITDLAQISALRIVSRTTVMGYGRPNKPLPQIARELNVDGIVEGTVQRSGDHVRITAQLIYGPADQHLWADSFERDIKDVLELENSVAGEIAHQIQVKVAPEERARLLNARAVNPKALDAYVEARFHLDQATKLEYYQGKRQQENDEFRKAVSYLDTAIHDDSNYIPAYVAYFDALESFYEHLEYLPKAKGALTKALELDPANVPARLALARLLMQFEYDWAGAEREYKKAIEVNPNSADAHFQYSEYLRNVDRRTEGDKEFDLAQSLNPAHDYFADATNDLERDRRTLEQQREALEEKAPHDPFANGVMAKDYAIAGRYAEAVEMYERCLNLYGWKDFANVLRRGDASGGAKYALEEWMRAADEYSKTHNDLPVVTMAFTYSSLGDKDRAFAWLDKGVEQRSWMIIYLKRDTVWDPLRSDPRFSALLRRVGLPAS